MVNSSSLRPSYSSSLLGLARHLVHGLTAAASGRPAIHRRETTLDALQLVEPGLLSEEQSPARGRASPIGELASMSPAVLAATVICQPRRGR